MRRNEHLRAHGNLAATSELIQAVKEPLGGIFSPVAGCEAEPDRISGKFHTLAAIEPFLSDFVLVAYLGVYMMMELL
jgi:hypothetical protein